MCSATGDVLSLILPQRVRDRLTRLFAQSGTEVYLVGGAVRDFLMGRNVSDLDFAVGGHAFPLARDCARCLRAAFVPLDPEHDTARVVCRDGLTIDFAGLRGADAIGDLLLRDFTINAIAIKLPGGSILDPLDGRADIRARRIRLAGAQAFTDDPLRVLRAFRFASQLGFAIEPDTLRAIAQHAGGLGTVAGERIWSEWEALAVGNDAPRAIELMFGTRTLVHLFPWLASADSDACQRLFRELHQSLCHPPGWFAPAGQRTAVDDDPPWSVALLTAALLLPARDWPGDEAQLPQTRTGYLSARFHLSAKLTKRLGALSAHVDAGLELLTAAAPPDLLPLHRYAQQAGEAALPLFLLAAASARAAGAAVGSHAAAMMSALADVVLPALAKPPILGGNDLIRMGFTPGPRFQEMLRQIREGQITGQFTTAAAAEAFVRSCWPPETP